MVAAFSSVEMIRFFRLKDRLRLTHLCGMPMANAPVLSPRALGLAVAGSSARRFEGDDLHMPSAVVELGLADENLHLTLKPGESLELPEILCLPLPDGEVHSGAPLLHRYLLNHHFSKAKPEAPVVYNTFRPD